MNYELFKKLKDTGWPQDDEEWRIMIDDSGKIDFSWNLGDGRICIPTLEELISACASQFWMLEARHIKDKEWEARGYDKTGTVINTYGETLTEAVANLWLVLNSTQ